jgi:4-amino-4-deoxy-L-arabinose transferase-like glycosyltransferase
VPLAQPWRFREALLYWGLSSSRRYLPLATCALGIAGFYLYNLSGVGMISTDEPRYAAVGQAMAHSGDLVTPYLWGSPWFEKPPLLYWMSAAFFALGERPEVAARLPVSLLSLAFLVVAARLAAREFGVEAAFISVSLLATCAGWVAYSNFCLTDLPMAVFFSLAVLLALPLLRDVADTRGVALRFLSIGACLGLAVLAKGLVPLALSLPMAWFLRRRWRLWVWAALACLLVAGPWYMAIYLRQGMPFVRELFFKHHFERMYSSSLQHVQPWYYYVPVMLGALFPWTPLLLLFTRRRAGWDRRRSLLLTSVFFGFLFFSVFVNKLPGYLLPLLPPLMLLLGAEFDVRSFAELSRRWLVPSALLIALIPPIAKGLPAALAAGNITAFHIGPIGAVECFYIAAPLAALFFGRRSWLAVLLVLCVVAGGILLKASAYPVLDEQVSARGLWRELQRRHLTVCDGGINRAWAYGISFYRGSELPRCGNGESYDRVLRARGRERPSVEAP